MEYKDYYAVLGVDKKATEDQIKQAYRRLARKFHPDVSKEANAEEKFKDVQEAYEVLKNKEKRAAYDQLGSNWKAGQEFHRPPGWDANTRFYSNMDQDSFSEEDLGRFSDFFSNLFGRGDTQQRGHASRAFKQRGGDQQAKIHIPLEEAFHGVTRNIQLQIPEVDAEGNMRHGLRTLKINIPAGAHQGQQLRLAQQGMPGFGGGPPGDLYLEIEIVPHPLYSLQGNDVYLTLPVTPWEAALGSEIRIPTLGGNVGLKLAAGAQSGQKLRLKGRGMPAKPHPGDQYAIVQIDTPPARTEEQKALYKKMAQIMPYDPQKELGGVIMEKNGIVIIADYTQDTRLTLDELLSSLNLDTEFFQNLIEYEIIKPQGAQPNEWVFDTSAIKRARQAQRLQRDLEINVAGIALVLQLMDELEELRARADLMERHLLR